MVENIKGNTLMIKNMVMVNLDGKMVKNIKANGKMGSNMEKVH